MAVYTETLKRGKLVGELTHEGLVVSIGEKNWHDDSDFYAVVWNPETKRTEVIEYATTRAYTYGNWAEVDFDWEKYGEDYRRFQRIQEYEVVVHRLSTLYQTKADKGKRVRVVKGRKVPVGTEGTILSVTYSEYSCRSMNHRVILKTDSGDYRDTYMNNLEVIPPTQEELGAMFAEIVGE